MNDIGAVFYEFRLHEGAMWIDNDIIKFSIPKKFQNEETKNFFVKNKEEIVAVLKENQIFSKEKFLSTNILSNKHLVYYPLSSAQERLWFIEQYEQGTNAYHMPRVLELDPAADIAGIKYALEGIVWRHEILRSTIEQRADLDHGIQVVHYKALFIEEIRLGAEEDYEIVIKSDINRPFDLSLEYPIRAKFYILESESGGQRRFLLINMHHIASDGWSMDIFQRELLSYYKGYIDGDKTFALPALDIQYKDFAVWQRNYLTGEVLENQLGYWKSKLSGYVPLEFPADHIRPSQIDYRGSHQNFVLSKEVSEQLRLLAQKLGVTLHSVMLSSVNILLGKYTGQDDIVIGTPIANRHHRQTQDLIGFFVNTQVNRTILSKGQSYVSLIDQVHQDQIEGQLHQDLPFEKLVEELGVDRDASRHPIFQVMFVVESSKIDKVSPAEEIDYLKPVYFEGSYEVEKFDLSIFIDDSQESLMGSVSYATNLFNKDTIERFIGHYEHLLAELVKAPEQCYDQISLLLPSEYKEMVYDWNATDKDYPVDKTIYELFQAQAESTPDSVALVYEGQELSYRELNERSNQLARHIRLEYEKRTQEALRGDSLIALCLDRGLEMVIGILAVLKSGGAYVPIDPEYPQDRIDYILEDTGAVLVLSQKHLLNKEDLQLPKDKVITIDLGGSIYDGQDISNLPQHSGAKNLAYVIYTSGTTGRPKGVMIEHAGVVNLIMDLLDKYGIVSSERFILFANYVFDASVEQIFLAILSGSRLFLVENKFIMNTGIFVDFISNNRITHLHSTPSYLITIDPSKLNLLKRLVFGAEYLKKDLFVKFKRYIPVVINKYGPTETTVTSLISFNSNLLNKASIQNTRAYALDTNNQPVPVGVIGELHIGGAGLARGYLNRDDLTSERFIGNPFATDADKSKGYDRLYKTGDLVRWLVDGNLEYIGRNDDQVKIRGYRIELGEIEHALSSIAGISQSSVLVRERETSGGIIKSLVGYYVAEEGDSNLDQGMILEQLSAVLPEYMIPGVLIAMDSFPLTINGKLDKRSLPDPDFSVAAEDYQAPSTAMEILVCGIWQEVLGLERVGVTDNFFRIGGNSILAIQVSHRMSSALGCYIKIADIFKYKTILDLLAHNVESIEAVIPKTAEKQSILSFSQERLWFIEQYEQGTNAYHMPRVLELDQATDIAGIKYALEGIVWRHEILRSTIEQSEDLDHGIQVVHDKALFIEEIRLGAEEDYESVIKSDINRPFDLSLEYPIRAKFYTVESESGGERRFLLINIHHIASDGWSMNIFQRELLSYYKGYIDGDKAFALPALDIQYKDFAVWQRNYLSGEVLENQLGYWKSKLTGYVPLEFPTDHLRPSQIDYRGSHQNFVLSKEVSEQLRLLAQRLGVTLHSVMLSSINILLGKYTGQDDIVIGSPIANRHHRQTQDLIGFFVNTQVNRTILSKGQSYVSLIDQVHQDQIEGQLHQDLPFEKLVEELGVDRDASRHPIFQVMFVVESSNTDREVHTQEISSFKPVYFEGSYEVEKFDLSIFIDDSQESLMGSVGYAVSLFDKDTIERFIGHYEHLLAELVKAPEQCYDQISLLLPSEHQEMVYDWNATDKDYPQDKTIYELFQAQAESTPDSVALVYDGQELSYRELNERSNQLARHIRCEYQKRTQEALRADSLIALCLDRGLEMIIGILAVVKSGGAYVPIDPEYPQERIDYILEDTGAVLVLSQKHLLDKEDLQLPKDKVITIDLGGPIYDGQDSSNLPQHSGAKNLAYVIYTSGTTGRPKGVMIEHKAFVQFLFNFRDYVKDGFNRKQQNVLSLTNYVFDIFGLEYGLPLIGGNKVTLSSIYKIKEEELVNIDLVQQTPSSLIYLVTHHFNKLKNIVCLVGGEALPSLIADKLLNAFDRLINVYGPAETVIWSSSYEVKKSEEPYIGKALPNEKAYVLDTNNQPVPVGVIGELHIGGAGLARGYLNRDDLTSERFIGNPFATDADKSKGYDRLYKTGDLVRWLVDGNLEYIGRNDDQVKIRGYRIELGEIEHALSSIAGISQSSVLVRERETSGGIIKSLVGYYVAEEGDSNLDQGMILEQLSAVLPEYMIPGVLIAMDSFPLTINGKLDKRSLPDPDFSVAAEDYQAPSTAMEILVCGIWQDVLGLDRVGVTDNFFRIGGNSILAIQVSHRMSSALDCSIKVSDIFKFSTINKLYNNKKDYLINNNIVYEEGEI
ncbi:amino acid adenylation domain-containing protein [Flavobacterium pectinovorum]|uniref:non-ribosomal peptide synthetase n=1 Tax=Flavobacterium pectinovorum TaxID=29533 RepID=UPI00265D7216|nr:non-ribosomal peptide synthetase [Flavobacterium pectinovorum]WKL50106.1 amino acid adenylation domain-containing protein [Flavobacterium pectinovorum]